MKTLEQCPACKRLCSSTIALAIHRQRDCPAAEIPRSTTTRL